MRMSSLSATLSTFEPVTCVAEACQLWYIVTETCIQRCLKSVLLRIASWHSDQTAAKRHARINDQNSTETKSMEGQAFFSPGRNAVSLLCVRSGLLPAIRLHFRQLSVFAPQLL